MVTTEDQKDRARAQLRLAKWIYDASPSVARQMASRVVWKGATEIERVEHPHDQVSGLVHYLLLTCFDILGGKNDWMPFGTWLNARDRKSERDAAGELGPDGTKAAKQLLDHYNKLYGAKTSFVRFINQIMTPEQRRKVLSSIDVADASDSKEHEDRRRVERLYQIRSKFTHEGIAAGSIFQVLRAHGAMVADVFVEYCDGAWKTSASTSGIGRAESDRTQVKLCPYVLFDVLSEQVSEVILPAEPLLVRIIRGEQQTDRRLAYARYTWLTGLDQPALAEFAAASFTDKP